MSRDTTDRYEPTWQVLAQRAKEERFRRVALNDPDISAVALGERFSLTIHEVWRWCIRLGVPRPPPNDIHGIAAWLKGSTAKTKKSAERRKPGRLSPGGGA